MVRNLRSDLPRLIAIGLIWFSGLLAGCGLLSQHGNEPIKSRFGACVLGNYDALDKSAKYDASNHTLKSNDACLTVYFPDEPKAVVAKGPNQQANDLPGSDNLNMAKPIRRGSNQDAYRFLLAEPKVDLLVCESQDRALATHDLAEYRALLNKCCTRAVHDFSLVESSRHPIRSAKDNSLEGLEAEGHLAVGPEVFRLQMFADTDGHLYKLLAAGESDPETGMIANQFFDSLTIPATSTLSNARVQTNPGKGRSPEGGFPQRQSFAAGRGFATAGAAAGLTGGFSRTNQSDLMQQKTYTDQYGNMYSGSGNVLMGPGGMYVKTGHSVRKLGGGGFHMGYTHHRHF
jgi:hypothetical protein